MRKNALYILILVVLLLLAACTQSNEPSGDLGQTDGSQNSASPKNDAFVLKATVSSTEEAGRLLVEVTESDYAFGPYWVLVSDDTLFLDESGKTIAQSEICAGDTIEITYGGQVMMSYPPQIVASRVQKLGEN